MRLIIVTQSLENYGAHMWDGTGHCPQHWMSKGGQEYEVYLPSTDGVEDTPDYVSKIVDKARAVVESNQDHYKEYVVNWQVLPVNELTEYERFCVDYIDGYVRTHKLEWLMTPDGDSVLHYCVDANLRTYKKRIV